MIFSINSLKYLTFHELPKVVGHCVRVFCRVVKSSLLIELKFPQRPQNINSIIGFDDMVDATFSNRIFLSCWNLRKLAAIWHWFLNNLDEEICLWHHKMTSSTHRFTLPPSKTNNELIEIESNRFWASEVFVGFSTRNIFNFYSESWSASSMSIFNENVWTVALTTT